MPYRFWGLKIFTSLRLRFQDFQRGSRPRVIRQQQFEAAYVFGAICPAEGKAAALIMPQANSESMQQHLDLIAATVTPGKYAVLVVDRAAWHVTKKLQMPANLSILPLPPYSPELNPVEQIWQQLRQTDWANRCFKGYDEIVDVCCQAWNQFASQPDTIRNLCTRIFRSRDVMNQWVTKLLFLIAII